MSKDWRDIATGKVGSDRKVKIPEKFVSLFEAGEMDDSVFWNYEKHSNYIVLSNRPLTDDNYQPVSRSKIFDENGHRKIRPKDHFPDELLSHFYHGNKLYYMAYEEMVDEDGLISVFLLTEDQVIRLLPGQDSSDVEDIQTRVLSTPGFMPSPL